MNTHKNNGSRKNIYNEKIQREREYTQLYSVYIWGIRGYNSYLLSAYICHGHSRTAASSRGSPHAPPSIIHTAKAIESSQDSLNQLKFSLSKSTTHILKCGRMALSFLSPGSPCYCRRATAKKYIACSLFHIFLIALLVNGIVIEHTNRMRPDQQERSMQRILVIVVISSTLAVPSCTLCEGVQHIQYINNRLFSET